MSGIHQAYYTSVREGPTGTAGFQFVATSQGFDPAILSSVERLLGYRPPTGSSPSPDSAEIASFPVLRVFERLDSGEYVLIRTRYLGEDYSGRFGNYFAHVVALSPQLAPLHLKPVDLFELDWWLDSGGIETPFPEPVFPSESSPVSLSEPLGEEGQLVTLASALRLIVDGQHTLYIEDQQSSVRGWLDLCYAIVPETSWWDLTFTSCAPDPSRVPGRIRFSEPDGGLQLQAYELRSTASLVRSIGESSGPTNPFGRIAGGLAASADFSAVDSLREKIRLADRVPTGNLMDGVAIAAEGDPELHDLTEEESLGAILAVLGTGDSLFTIRHVGWVFDQLSPERSADAAALFATTLGKDSDLARDVSRAAFEWLLRNGEPSSLGQRLTAGSLADAWTDEWFGVLASTEGPEYTQVLINGLSLGLAAKEDRARELGVEIGSMVATGRVSIEVLSDVKKIPGGAISEIVEFALSEQPEFQFGQEVFRHPVIESELARQMRTTKDLHRGLRLWRFAAAIGMSFDEKDVKRVVSLVGNRREAEELLLAASEAGSTSFETQAALLAMCVRYEVPPGRNLMRGFEAGLPRVRAKDLKKLVELYTGLERIGVRTPVGDAILFLGTEPHSDRETLGMIDEASRILTAPISGDLKQQVAEYLSESVAATDDPRAHLDLVRRIIRSRSEELEAAYLERMKYLLSRKKHAAQAGALIFLTWNDSDSSPIGVRNRDRILRTLKEKQRSKVKEQLPPRYRSEWGRWCESNRPKGRFSLGRAKR